MLLTETNRRITFYKLKKLSEILIYFYNLPVSIFSIRRSVAGNLQCSIFQET